MVLDVAIDFTQKLSWRKGRKETSIRLHSLNVLVEHTELMLRLLFNVGFFSGPMSSTHCAVLLACNASSVLLLHPLHFFLLPLGLILGINNGFAIGKINMNFLKSGTVGVFNPRVVNNVGHLNASGRVKLNQASNQVLEIVREVIGSRLVFAVSSPE
jgi:hypothetical protein